MKSSRRAKIQISVCGRFQSITPIGTALLAFDLNRGAVGPDGASDVKLGARLCKDTFSTTRVGAVGPVQPNPTFSRKLG
jgi:hypothetical protein